MTRRPLCNLLIASCTQDGGVLRYELHEDGGLVPLDTIPMPSPMFLAQQGKRLWAALRAPFCENNESGLAAYSLLDGERLTPIASTRGVVACHIAVDGDDVYAANYLSGSVFSMPDRLDVHTGQGSDPVRQEAPHVHSTFLSPDRKYLLSCDLGLDRIFVYDRSLKLCSTASVPAGAGARHLVFSRDGRYVYCVNEMAASVSVFLWHDGELTYLHDHSVKPKDFCGQGKGSAIVLNRAGTRLFVTERGSQTVAVFDVDGENLTLLAHFDVHGEEPRDFALVAEERFAICVNQFSDNITVYEVTPDGLLRFLHSKPLKTPICVIEEKPF